VLIGGRCAMRVGVHGEAREFIHPRRMLGILLCEYLLEAGEGDVTLGDVMLGDAW
jgi:hypothetical protein